MHLLKLRGPTQDTPVTIKQIKVNRRAKEVFEVILLIDTSAITTNQKKTDSIGNIGICYGNKHCRPFLMTHFTRLHSTPPLEKPSTHDDQQQNTDERHDHTQHIHATMTEPPRYQPMTPTHQIQEEEQSDES